MSFDLKPSILNISNKENKLQLPRTSNHIENSQRRKKQKSTKFMKKVNSSSMHQVYGLSPEIDTLQSSVVERLAFKSFVVDNQIIINMISSINNLDIDIIFSCSCEQGVTQNDTSTPSWLR